MSVSLPKCFKQPQQLDEAITIPKETVEVLRGQVFGFDTFFVTGQEPYEVSR